MAEVVCGTCGRSVMLAPGETRSCPSCGASLSAPAAPIAPATPTTPAASAASGWDSDTRKVDDVSTVQASAQEDGATRPVDLPISTAPAAPPAPPISAASATPAVPAVPAAPMTASAETLPPSPAYVPPGWGPGAPGAPGVGGQPPFWPGNPQTQSLPAGYVPPPTPGAWYPYGAPQQPLQQGLAPALAPAQPQQQPRRHTGLIIGSVVALVILLAVAGAGVLEAAQVLPNPFAQATLAPTATPGPTATPAPPPGYSIQADTVGYYRFYYPTNWHKTATASGDTLDVVLFSDPANGAGVGEETLGVVDPAGPDHALNAFLQGFSSSTGGTATNVQMLADQTISGETWKQGSADYPAAKAGGIALHAVVLVTVHDEHTFVLLKAVPMGENVDTTADDAAFQTLLSSFTFLK